MEFLDWLLWPLFTFFALALAGCVNSNQAGFT